MSKPKVFVTRRIPEKGLSIVRDFCDADIWQDEMPPAREDLLRRAEGVEGLLSLLTDRIDGAVMDASANLRVISNMAVGVDNVDVAAAQCAQAAGWKHAGRPDRCDRGYDVRADDGSSRGEL